MARHRLSFVGMTSKKLSSDKVRLGYVPLADCATLVVASELGYFEKHGVEVELIREPGWATIRDKIIYGELELAHSVIGLPFAITYGLGCLRHDCVTGFIFNAHGDGITLSNRLVERGVTDANQLAVEIKTSGRERPITIGIPHAFSAHHFILNQWLKPAGIIPGRDVQLVVLPPSLMADCIGEGHIDGFCVGEPFNTIAEQRELGKLVCRSSEISPHHPEKALLTTREFAETREADHLAVIAALADASQFCETPQGRTEAISILTREEHLGFPASVLKPSLDRKTESAEDFHLFGGAEINRPDMEKASWVIGQMRSAGLMEEVKSGPLNPPVDSVFRPEIYDAAISKNART